MPAQKGFAQPLILTFILVALLGTLFYSKKNSVYFKPLQLYQLRSTPETLPSPDPFSGWKIYTNKTSGFSLRYPKEWFIKEHSDYAADFLILDPSVQKATGEAVKLRFIKMSENIDIAEFEKIYKADPQTPIRERLDVISTITKIKNLRIDDFPAVEFAIDRKFSALEGPKGEYSHVYEIKKDETILKFIRSASTKAEERTSDGIFQQIISSFDF